jgi:hypothetical protein
MSGRLIILCAALALVVPSLIAASDSAAPAASPVFLSVPRASSPALAASPGPLLPGATVVVSGASEPSILVDRNGQYIWIGAIYGSGMGMWRSTNGSRWLAIHPTELPGAFTDGTAMAQGPDGMLYAADTQGQVVAVDASPDGGLTWTEVNRVATPGVPFADRPWLATSPTTAGDVTLVINGNGGEECLRSTDGGVVFTPASVGQISNAANLVRDALGDTYYATAGGFEMWRGACMLNPTALSLPASGAQIFTQVAVAGSGTNGGHIYTAQPSSGNGAMEIRGAQGIFGQVKRLAINPPAALSNTFGGIAVKPDDSEIAVVWYGSDTAGDPSSQSYPPSATWTAYVARVTGFWTATPTVNVTAIDPGMYHGWFCMGGVSCTSGRDLSDYNGITYGPDGKLYVTWGHETGANGSGQVDVRFANLG